MKKTKLNPAVREYFAQLGARSAGKPKTLTGKQRRQLKTNMANARAAITPEVIARRAAARRRTNELARQERANANGGQK